MYMVERNLQLCTDDCSEVSRDEHKVWKVGRDEHKVWEVGMNEQNQCSVAATMRLIFSSVYIRVFDVHGA
jgi:hypothetical protein